MWGYMCFVLCLHISNPLGQIKSWDAKRKWGWINLVLPLLLTSFSSAIWHLLPCLLAGPLYAPWLTKRIQHLPFHPTPVPLFPGGLGGGTGLDTIADDRSFKGSLGDVVMQHFIQLDGGGLQGAEETNWVIVTLKACFLVGRSYDIGYALALKCIYVTSSLFQGERGILPFLQKLATCFLNYFIFLIEIFIQHMKLLNTFNNQIKWYNVLHLFLLSFDLFNF